MYKRIYPVGAIYTSVNDIHPSKIFGFGTWVAIENKFLYCVPTATSAGSSGGSSTHNHQYGMRWAGWYSSVCGRGGDNLQFWNGSSWVSGSSDGTGSNNHASNYNTTTINYYQSQVNTSSSSALPPYVKIHAWKRTA